MCSLIQIDLGNIIKSAIDFVKQRNASQEAVRAYLETSITKNRRLGEDWISNGDFILDIEHAFIPMRLLSAGDGKTEELTSLFNRYRRVVIQGPVGAGKSTVTRFITVVMAKSELNPQKWGYLSQKHLSTLPLFPLRIEMKKCNDGTTVYQAALNAVPFVEPKYIEQRLKEGKLFVLFDGLDEVADPHRRGQVMKEIVDFVDSLQRPGKESSFVVTTRPASYNHHILARGEFVLFSLQELNPKQQERMIRRYYSLWSEKEAIRQTEQQWQAKASELVDQLQSSTSLARLKSSPLLLSWITMLHYQGHQLPVRRHALYQKCVEHLITRRDETAPVERAKTHKLLLILGELAFEMHLHKDKSYLTQEEVEKIFERSIRKYLNKNATPEAIADLVGKTEKEWGLLINHERDKTGPAHYSFSNQSLQEYLAGYVAFHQTSEYWPILSQKLHDPWWDEVISIYTSMGEIKGNISTLDQVLNELLKDSSEIDNKKWIQAGKYLSNGEFPGKSSSFHNQIVKHLQNCSYEDTEDGSRAFEALCRIESDGQKFVMSRILQNEHALDPEALTRLLLRMKDSEARQTLRQQLIAKLEERPTIQQRVILAEALGQIGDTRLGQLVGINSRLKKENRLGFKIGKYLVTNEEYKQFTQAIPYRTPLHWTNNGSYLPQFANHPVTGVTLEDAMAYCQWQTKEIGVSCRLPTENEWLIAADPDNLRTNFPWGHHLDQHYVNTRGNIEHTTPVGIYPEGQSKDGVTDLLGNVWEWTSTSELIHTKNELFVLKGCAWDTIDSESLEDGVYARRLEPSGKYGNNIGFRILVEANP